MATERRLSLNKVADFSGVDRSAFYEALRGDSSMTLDRLCKVANALGVEPWRLLNPTTAGDAADEG